MTTPPPLSIPTARDDALPIVRCIGAGRVFGTGRASVVAVHDTTCDVMAGQQIAIVGPSGSGKSTLLHLLAGLDTPTAGTITWPALGTRDVLRPGPIGIVFQGPSLLPPLDVAENVALPLLLSGIDPDEAAIRAHRALTLLAVDDLAAKLPEELSGGQAQRVAIARALVGDARLIIADEPTGQLDHVAGGQVLDALIATATKTGASVVVTTHDDELAARMTSRWVMADGHLYLPAAQTPSHRAPVT